MNSRWLLFIFVVGFALAASWVSLQKGPRMYLAAKKIPHRMEIHGDVRVDDYFWMRERDTAPVMEFLRQENARTAEAMKGVQGLEKKLYSEMRARVKEDESSVPVYDSGYYYYWRYQTGQEYPLHCRRKGTMDAPEEIFLDENVEAKGHTFYDLAAAEFSPDQNILAYAVDVVGRRIYDIRFKDLRTGKILADHIDAVTPNLVWAADSKTLFYTKQDPETLRSFQVFRYELGRGAKPELVYEEADTTYGVGVSGSKTRHWIFLSAEKRDSSEVRVLDARRPKDAFQILQPREMKHEYSVEDGGDRFYILTNWQAKNFRLMEAPFTARDKSQWKEVIAHNSKVFLENFDVYAQFMVISQRENGQTQLALRPRGDKGKVRLLVFPDPIYEVEHASLPDYESTKLRFNYESPVQPPAVFEEDFLSGQREMRKQREVPGFDKNRYEAIRVWATAKDGARIPVALIQRKGRARNGGPALLYGYGSYGLSMDDGFRSTVLSLVDRGFVFAIAHIRGGSEMGRDWYENGRLQHKMNTFTDFIAAAETLIGEKYTSPEHLHIMGGSAGGLLMGATINLRPELFKSAIAQVPFVDVLTTMLDESIPLTTGEYNEWGDPRIAEQYKWMRAYSPYDNVVAKAYPNLFVATGYHDSQVQYWEPAKWVAKLRELKTDQNLLLMYTELEAGHSGATGRFEALKTLAKEYAFILMLEGITD
jgi:oligopeptidase B